MAPSRPTLVRPESPWNVVRGRTLRPTRSLGRGQGREGKKKLVYQKGQKDGGFLEPLNVTCV